MKYVTCKLEPGEGSAAQEAIDWLYICEDAPKKGDTVYGNFGGWDNYMTVVAVSTRRSTISSYPGSLKTVRLCGPAERKVRAELEEAWNRVATAEGRAQKVQERLERFQ